MSYSTDLKEKCAVVGVYGIENASQYIFLCLHALQHRGQEGSGILTVDNGSVYSHRGLGLIGEVFNNQTLESLKGSVGIGHNRYSTSGSVDLSGIQPFSGNTTKGATSLAHNGNLTNHVDIREHLVSLGHSFASESDTEVFIHLLSSIIAQGKSFEEALIEMMGRVEGAFSLVLTLGDKLAGMRDTNGYRPLVLGRLGDGYILASETAAFDLIEAEYIREIEPGEIVVIDESGVTSYNPLKERIKAQQCIFEHVYFSRPDSIVFGRSVYEMRIEMGRQLAKQFAHELADADCVVPVPDSGIVATLGYSRESGTPFELGIIRNHYVGRTFIESQQSIRDLSVRLKLNPVSHVIKNKKVIVIDDSIVRGTTCKKIVNMIKKAGASKVYLLSASPPVMFPCQYGIDTPTSGELIINNMSKDSIKEYVGADFLGYLSLERLLNSSGAPEKYCKKCFAGDDI